MSVQLDSIPVALLQVGSGGRIEYVNERAQALLGVERSVSVGADVASVLMPLAELRSRGRESARARFSVPGAAGERVFGFQCAEEPDGSCVVVFQDITKVEETQRERNRLLQLASISEVMPAVLHELKNPLAAITAALEVLLEDVARQPIATPLHEVLTEVRRLSLTLDGLGRFRHEVRSARGVAIDLAVREAARLLEPQAHAKGLVYSVQVPDMPLLPFEAAALRAVVFNLVTNAIHACTAGQTVSVETSWAPVTRVLTLRVKDTGVGMPASVLARCTELFFTTKPKGSGIGLALCAGVAEAVGGSLAIDSEPGRGTTVVMTFPLIAAAPPGTTGGPLT